MGNQLVHGFRQGVTALLAAATLAASTVPAVATPAADHPVIELRQYKIVPGKRDAFIVLFDRWFVESQEALGARLVGQFRDDADANRFTWIRAFPDMAKRTAILQSFYYGPVWLAHRDAANPLLDDNDNVLLLRPATPDLAFGAATGTRPAPGVARAAHDKIVVTIHYLWKTPDPAFTAFFHDRLAPALRKGGVEVIGGYVPEEAPNGFPRLPVRQGEKVFVWFARSADRGGYDRALRRLTPALRAQLADFEERDAQVLTLTPTARSLLR